MASFGLRLMFLGFAALGSGAATAQQPTPEQARALLRQRPDLAARIQEWVSQSGLTPDQIRSRLSAAGYSATMLDAYFPGMNPDSLPSGPTDSRLLAAVRALGIVGTDEAALLAPDTVPGRPGEPRRDLPADSDPSLEVFGLDVFRRVSSQFQPASAGPVDATYRLGPGDVLVLILSGDVEAAHTLEVTRDGFVVIPQVGQVYVSGLTMDQLDKLLLQRLGRVYSGVRPGPNATTRFQATVARLRTNQIFVVGEVARPGSYQVSSAGTVLTALYLAGGPKPSGSFRRVEIRRGGKLIDSLDLYDYLLHGNNSHDIRLETSDVVFVGLRGLQAEIRGAIPRPAIYELRSGETLRDLVAAAGGFEPFASQRRIQVDRILPPGERGPRGRDRVVIDIAADQMTDDGAPPFPLVPGDRVTVFAITSRRRNVITVQGNVWNEGQAGFRPGMRLSEAIRLAGGPKPDVYLGQILISRLAADSTRSQLRSAFRDTTGTVVTDLLLAEDDVITVFSRTTFRPNRIVVVTGAVKVPQALPFRDGMTLRDAILEADGLTEDALIGEVEIARLPPDRAAGALAQTVRVTIDSTYLFDRGPNGEYRGPPGRPGPSGGTPEVPLQPYDNVLVLRQPEWELHRTVTIIGKVNYPGTYSLKTRSDHLTDLIHRAGGLTRDAYPRGAELFRRVRTDDSPTAFRVIDRLARWDHPDSASGNDSTEVRPRMAQRVGLDLPRALAEPYGRGDLILRSGDSIYVPEYDPTVRVVGAVNAPTAVIHRPGWNLDDYVAAAGGFSRRADRGRAYLVQPGGEVESVRRRFLLPDGKPKPEPGGLVYVPERDPNDKKDWAGLLGSIAQILASTVAIVVVATR
jgi:protein involved in polysaccharide export with SLBB domain